MVNSDLGELVGRLYVEKYFTPEAKIKMIDMVNRLNIELKKRLMKLSWMSDETKQKIMTAIQESKLENHRFQRSCNLP